MMKKTAKFAIGITAAAAVATMVAGVIHELRAIKKITTDADDALPEEILAEEEETVVEVIGDAE